MKRRVVITGMGAVTPIGNCVEELWQGVLEGRCGIGPITAYDPSAQKVKLAAEVKNLDLTALLSRDIRRLDRFAQLGLVAAREAFIQSRVTPQNTDFDRCGIIFSSGIGGLPFITTEQIRGMDRGFDRVSPFFIPGSISNMAAGVIAIDLGLRGMCTCVVTACASSTNAIGDAFRQIRDGYAEVMVCGGAESTITPLAMGGFTSMKALCESQDPARASIPFDRERSGFVMGEGAGALVLEEEAHAKARGAVIYGEIVGYGATCDAYHITAPSIGGEGAARCITSALADAGLAPEAVDYINAHGTSTPMNDRYETAAIKKSLGKRAGEIPVSSTKSMLGHLLGASGAVEAIVTVLALREGFIPPTIGYREADPECDLDIVPGKGRHQKLHTALSNSLGFGGHNAVLAFCRY